MKIVPNRYATDREPKLPPSLEQEMYELERQVFDLGKPVVHQVKQLMLQYPEYPEPGYLLATIYDLQGKKQQAFDLALDLHKRFPFAPELLALLGELYLNEEAYDEMEKLADFSLPFEKQFPNRKLVTVNEWYPYEEISIEWLLVNDELILAHTRIAQVMQTLELLPDAQQYYKELIELLEEFIEPDEYTPATQELLQILYKKSMGNQYRWPARLRHPETTIIQRELYLSDIPEVVNLLKLPGDELAADLRILLRDMYTNDLFYRSVAPEELQPELPIVGFLLLAELGMPGEIDEWLHFLRKPGNFIEWWMGDLLLEMGYLVSWKLGRNDLPRMEQALLEKYSHEWASNTLVTGLILTLQHEPSKKAEILAMFERVSRQLLDHDLDDGQGNLLAALLQFGVAENEASYIPMVKEAYGKNKIIQYVYGNTPEYFINESRYWTDPLEAVEYQRSLQPFDKLLEFLLTPVNL